MREALEETSPAVKIEKPLYILTIGDSENHFYLCKYLSGEPKLGNGPEQYKADQLNQYKPMWVHISEVSSLELKPAEVKMWFIEDTNIGFSFNQRIFTRNEDSLS